MDKFQAVTLTLDPWAGAVVSTAVKDAAILALTENRVALLKFNGSTIIVEPNKIIGDLLKQYPMGSDEGK